MSSEVTDQPYCDTGLIRPPVVAHRDGRWKDFLSDLFARLRTEATRLESAAAHNDGIRLDRKGRRSRLDAAWIQMKQRRSHSEVSDDVRVKNGRNYWIWAALDVYHIGLIRSEHCVARDSARVARLEIYRGYIYNIYRVAIYTAAFISNRSAARDLLPRSVTSRVALLSSCGPDDSKLTLTGSVAQRR